jgi:hypothetical protein
MFLLLMIGQVPQAPPPPQAPPIRVVPSGITYPYFMAAPWAAKTNLPLVTFVGCPGRRIDGATACVADSLTGYTSPCIVVSVPDGSGWLVERAVLPVYASDARIAASMRPKAVSQPAAVPFSASRPRPQAADGK